MNNWLQAKRAKPFPDIGPDPVRGYAPQPDRQLWHHTAQAVGG
jgi:hypothetical protein